MKLELRISGKIVIIEGEFTVEVRDECPAAVSAAKPAKPIQPPLPPPPMVADDSGLFRKLAGLRKEIAVKQNVPPYVIFHDKTLHEMIEKLPSSLQELGNISGVGQSKLEKYGEMFLSVIKKEMVV